MTNIFLKRINKEINDFNNQKYLNDQITNSVKEIFQNMNIEIYIITNSGYNHTYHMRIQHNNNFLLELIIPENYPFKPYIISDYCFSSNLFLESVERISYLKYLAKLTEINKPYNNTILSFFYNIQYSKPKFLKLNNHCCYCCSSFTCNNNWSPACKINNLLLEYLEIKFITKYCKKYNYKKIYSIYNELFNLYFNKLPDEIIKIIFDHLYA